MDELAINWLRDNAPAFVKAAIDTQEDEIHARVRATYDSVVADAWREKLAASEAENGRLTAELDEARAVVWMWDKMSELRISTISFDYGMGMIAAFDFDNEEIAEAETLERIFEIAQEWEINRHDDDAD